MPEDDDEPFVLKYESGCRLIFNTIDDIDESDEDDEEKDMFFRFFVTT